MNLITMQSQKVFVFRFSTNNNRILMGSAGVHKPQALSRPGDKIVYGGA